MYFQTKKIAHSSSFAVFSTVPVKNYSELTVLSILLWILFWYLCTFTEWGEQLLFLFIFQNITKQTNKQIGKSCVSLSSLPVLRALIFFFFFQWKTYLFLAALYHIICLYWVFARMFKQEIFFHFTHPAPVQQHPFLLPIYVHDWERESISISFEILFHGNQCLNKWNKCILIYLNPLLSIVLTFLGISLRYITLEN